MSPGFTGVSSGDWRTLDDEVTGPEVYLIYEDERLFRGIGPAPGTIEEIEPGTLELDGSGEFGWSVGENANIKVTGTRAGDPPFVIHRSAAAGATWTIPITTTRLAQLARAGDDAYALDGGIIYRTVDSGTIWNQIVAAPSDGAFRGIALSTTNLYIEFEPNVPQHNYQVKIAPITGGSPADLLHDGRIIGQVAEGMLLVDMAFSEPIGEVLGPWVLKRYVGSSPTTVSGIPDEFFETEVVSGENVIIATYNTLGVACKGQTAILVGRHKPTESSGMQGVIYRSTDKGLTFSEVKRWDLPGLTEKFGHVEVGYDGQREGIWWCGGAGNVGDGTVGLWRSEDDGLTWALVPSPSTGLVALDNTPQIISAGRPEGATR